MLRIERGNLYHSDEWRTAFRTLAIFGHWIDSSFKALNPTQNGEWATGKKLAIVRPIADAVSVSLWGDWQCRATMVREYVFELKMDGSEHWQPLFRGYDGRALSMSSGKLSRG
jgi:hypothetical protein